MAGEEFEEGVYEDTKEEFEDLIGTDTVRQGVFDKLAGEREKQISEGVDPSTAEFEEAPAAEPVEEKRETVEEEEGEVEDAEPEPSTPEPQTIRLKVNGQEMDMPIEEAKRILQMTTAAEAARKLQEATNHKPEPEPAKNTAPQEPRFRLPDAIRREILEVKQKLYYEGATTKEEADALLQREADLNFELSFAALRADEMERQAKEEAFNQAQIGKHLVSEVEKAHPDFNAVMFEVDETGKPRKDENNWNILNHDFSTWLGAQPDSIKYAALDSNDPRDPIAVLNMYKEHKRGGASIEQRNRAIAAKKKTIDPVKGGSGRAPAKPAYKEPTRAEIIAEMKRQRAKSPGY